MQAANNNDNLEYLTICYRSSVIAMSLLPFKTDMEFRVRRERNNEPEITHLLRYLH